MRKRKKELAEFGALDTPELRQEWLLTRVFEDLRTIRQVVVFFWWLWWIGIAVAIIAAAGSSS